MAHKSMINFTATISVAPRVEHKTSKKGKDYGVVVFEAWHNSWNTVKTNPNTGVPYVKTLVITVAEEHMISEVLAWKVGDVVELENVINCFDKKWITVGYNNGARIRRVEEFIEPEAQSLESQYSDAPF